MQLGLDVAPALVHVELHGDLAVVLEGEQQVVGVLHRDRAVLLDVARVDRARAFAPDVEHGLVDVVGEHQGERLEALNDLVHVLEHARHGLVLVHHAVEAEAPDGGAAERATAAAGGASCPACSRSPAPAAGGGTRRRSGCRPASSSRRGAGEPARSGQWSWSLRVELDDELFLGVDRDGVARGALGHPARRLVRIHREPGDRLAPRGGSCASLTATSSRLPAATRTSSPGRHPVGRDVHPVAVHLDVAVAR